MASKTDGPESLAEAGPILDRLTSAIFGVLYAIRGSFFVFFAALGILLVLGGVLLGRGELAGILGVLGVSAILYGVGGRVALRVMRY
jgi:hypothetical protein